jgi:UDP-GlcNAc:undecaprenyl-phosphate/decaprenyl-phosphate GlcNAc-1-phosphate transferase
MTTVSYFALIFAATLWLSRFLLRYMEPDMFMDHPSERKLHTEAKPRFGGIAFGIAIIVLGWFIMNVHAQYNWYFLGGIGMFALGAIDDYWSISWRFKLPAQILIGTLIVLQFVGQVDTITFFGLHYFLPIYALGALYLFWFIGVVNAVNLIDGMDGLSGGYIFLTSFFALLFGWLTDNKDFIYFNAIYMGAMGAFLHFNQKPAKFFMGDSGSLLLGFHVATLPLLFISTSSGYFSFFDVTPFVLLTSYLIIDTARVFYDRIKHKLHPLEPDQNHFHHLLYERSGSYRGTLLIIFLYLSIFGSFAVASILTTPGYIYMCFYLVLLACLIFISSANDFGISIVTRMIHTINWDEEHLPSYQALVRVRFLPILSFAYYVCIAFLSYGSLDQIISTPLLIGSLILIGLFTIKGSIFPYNSEIILIGFGMLQVLMLNLAYSGSLFGLSYSGEVIGSLIRYGLLGLIAVIAIINYVMRSKGLGPEFWRISDLLILFILVGLASVRSLGVGIPPAMAFELGIIYFANKLALPRLMSKIENLRELKAKASLIATAD